VPCDQNPFPVCQAGACPPGLTCLPDNAAGRCVCLAPPPPGAGEVPDQAPDTPLRLDKAAGGQITLEWGASCLATDVDYEIYEGTIGSWYSHGLLFCSTGGATTITFVPSTDSTYYLVVPTNGSQEGSYGTNSAGAERPQGAPSCQPQQLAGCP
jgi:hypothetical protein